MSLFSKFSTMSSTRLYMLVLGLCFLAEVEKCIASLGSSKLHDSTNTTGTTTISSRYHDGRKLESEDVLPGEFPFFAQWGGCGASLVWEDVLLTSASCSVVSDESVLVGAHISNQQQGDTVRRKVVSRKRHPEFDRDTMANNFMLLKLDERVEGLPHVWMDPMADIPKDADLYVVGFGFTASLVQVHQIYSRTFHHTVLDTSHVLQNGNDIFPNSRLSSSTLQKVKLSLVPHMTCNAYDQYAGFIDDETMICANDEDSTCLGDNGGPLCMMVNNECLQIGIVSFGESCMMGTRPIVFSSLRPVHGWIEKSICELSDNPPSTCEATVTVKRPPPVTERDNGRFPFWQLDNSLASKSTVESSTPMANATEVNDPIHTPLLEHKDITNATQTNISLIEHKENENLTNGTQTNTSQFETEERKSEASTLKRRNGGIISSQFISSQFAIAVEPSDLDPSDAPTSAQVTVDSIPVRQQGGGFFAKNQEHDRNLIASIDSFFDSTQDLPVVIIRLPEEEANSVVDPNESSSIISGINETPGSEQSLSDLLGLDVDVAQAKPLLSSKKLGLCEGDCDHDEDCEEGLYCFIKDGETTSVPGCSGFDTSRTDYCTKKTEDSPSVPKPFPMLFVFPENPPDPSNLPLKVCQGDCDSDADCAEGLICYHRPPNKITIPGCSGVSTTRTDFCVDPNNWRNDGIDDDARHSPTSEPTFSPTKGPTMVPLRIVTSSPTRQPTFTPPQDGTEEIVVGRNPVQQPRTAMPTEVPTISPTTPPLHLPTRFPTPYPSNLPTNPPQQQQQQTVAPTVAPQQTKSPTPAPTRQQTVLPTKAPTFVPTMPRTNAPTKLPTRAPTNFPTNPPTKAMVSVTFAIYFDPWPQEFSWKVENASTGQIIAVVPAGTYQSPQDHAFELLMLWPGEDYVLTIEDAGSDGIAGIGTLYEMYLTDHPSVKLVDGDGVFDSIRKQLFRVPAQEMYPSSAPTSFGLSPSWDNTPTVKVYLVIVFDNWHQETAWTIVDEQDPSRIYAEAEYDTYRSGETMTEEIVLPAGRVYVFTIRDFFNDGIQGGQYLLMDAHGEIIFEGDGDFGSFRSHAFQLPAWDNNNSNEIHPVFASMKEDDDEDASKTATTP